MAQFAFEAIGTHWQIDISDALTPEGEARVLSAIRDRIAQFDKDYSRFRDDSLVMEMSRKAGEYRLPDDAQPMFDLYRDLYLVTHGAMTPLIGQVLVDAGYDAAYSLKSKELHPPPAWDDALEYEYPRLTVKRPAILDVGAAGKGYLIDLVAQVIQSFGIRSFCVDAGGDILQKDTNGVPLRIGLEHPEHAEQVIGVASIANQSLCGSAGNRRTWGKYHHIIDPRTLESPREILAVWTVAPTALIADALTTCLFFVEPTLLDDYVFEYLIVYKDYSIKKSPNFPAELFER